MTEEYWTTRDGKTIAVGDMSEEHVRNTLRMILRNRRIQVQKQIKADEVILRGEMALASIEEEEYLELADDCIDWDKGY